MPCSLVALGHYSQIFVCYYRKPRKIIILLYLTMLSSFCPMSLRSILHEDRFAFKLEKEIRWFFLCSWLWCSVLWNRHFWKQFASPLIGFCLKEYFYVEAAACMKNEGVNWFPCRVQGKLSEEEETHSWRWPSKEFLCWESGKELNLDEFTNKVNLKIILKDCYYYYYERGLI